LGLERCVAMGVDMMETDVHMTADGYLVMIHDESVDRTTDGHGVISSMTLAEVRKLRLRQNLGGYAEPLTEEHVPTLDEMLKAAKGRITLNLDVKAPIYAEVVDAVLRAGAADLVTVKTRAGIASPALAAIPPFNKVPFVPVLNAKGSDIAAVAERQATNAKPVAFELPQMLSADVPKVVAVGRQHGIKLFSNTLGDGSCIGIGGDNDALKDPDAVWGWLYRNGISIFQTDRPEALLEFRTSLHK
jgi:glycerophosphoryl diester phosphodiesterase